MPLKISLPRFKTLVAIILTTVVLLSFTCTLLPIPEPVKPLERTEAPEIIKEPVIAPDRVKETDSIISQTKVEILPTPLTYCYLNGHYGTSQDLKFVFELLNLTKFSEFNPRLISGTLNSLLLEYGMFSKDVKKINDHGLSEFLCNLFDVVVVGDTNPDARFLLKWLHDSKLQA
jgi:hypothetical protein